MNKEQFVNMFGAEPGANLFLDAPGAKRALEEIPDHNTKKDNRKKIKRNLFRWMSRIGLLSVAALRKKR